MTVQELAWAAGLFEGEGTIRINKATKRNLGHLVVSVVSTDPQIVEFFQARWSGYMKAATGLDLSRQRPAWVWVIASRRAAAFIRDILPYFRRDLVRERAWLALEFQDQKRVGSRPTDEYREQQFSLYLQMRDLNVRGVQ